MEDKTPMSFDSVASTHSMLGPVVSTLSVIYCFFLLSIFIVPLATDLIVPKEKLDSYGYNTEGVLEFVQIYLASGSIVFFLYLLLGLTKPHRSALNDTGHTSAFVRVGGFVFGMGSIAYLTLRLIEDFYNTKCSSDPTKLVRGLSLMVTVLQMTAVILCSRIKIDQGWGAPHFGCMHLVATNLVTWVMTVYKESEHVRHLADDIKECVRKPENGTSHDSEHHRVKRAAGGGGECTPLSLDFEELFYPFQIEFVLIGKSPFSNLIFVFRRHRICQHLESHHQAGESGRRGGLGEAEAPALPCRARLWEQSHRNHRGCPHYPRQSRHLNLPQATTQSRMRPHNQRSDKEGLKTCEISTQ